MIRPSRLHIVDSFALSPLLLIAPIKLLAVFFGSIPIQDEFFIE